MDINQEGVQQALASHLLPRLDFKSLGVLSCTNRQMRNLIYDMPVAVWAAAARAQLPVASSLPDPCTRNSLQMALLRYCKALRGISTCQWHFSTSWSFPEPQFNSNGSHLACFVNNSIRLRNAFTGQEEVVLHLGDKHDGWLRFRWATTGTRAGLVMKSQSGEPLAGRGDMLDPAVREQGWDAMHQVPLPHTRWVWQQFDGPQWSPDLTKLIIQEASESSNNPPLTVVLDATTGANVWTSQASMPASPVWRPDSRALLFFAGRSGVGSQQHSEQVVSIEDNRVLWNSPRSAGDAANTAHNLHAFSPDGAQICTTFPVQREAIVVRISDGAHVQMLHGEGQNELLPASVVWAPDSLQIGACCAADGTTHPTRDAFFGIWYVGLGRLVTLPLGRLIDSTPGLTITGDPMMQWSPDARHLAVFCPTESKYDCISIVSVLAQAPVCVIRTQSFALASQFSMFELLWSPDASQIVVSFVHQQALDNGMEGGNDVADEQRDFVSAIVSFVNV